MHWKPLAEFLAEPCPRCGAPMGRHRHEVTTDPRLPGVAIFEPICPPNRERG
jgi:hypothetical protein